MLLKKYLIDSKITLTRVLCPSSGICMSCKYWDYEINEKGCMNIEIQGSETLVDRCYDVSEKVNGLYPYLEARKYDYNIQNVTEEV